MQFLRPPIYSTPSECPIFDRLKVMSNPAMEASLGDDAAIADAEAVVIAPVHSVDMVCDVAIVDNTHVEEDDGVSEEIGYVDPTVHARYHLAMVWALTGKPPSPEMVARVGAISPPKDVFYNVDAYDGLNVNPIIPGENIGMVVDNTKMSDEVVKITMKVSLPRKSGEPKAPDMYPVLVAPRTDAAIDNAPSLFATLIKADEEARGYAADLVSSSRPDVIDAVDRLRRASNENVLVLYRTRLTYLDLAVKARLKVRGASRSPPLAPMKLVELHETSERVVSVTSLLEHVPHDILAGLKMSMILEFGRMGNGVEDDIGMYYSAPAAFFPGTLIRLYRILKFIEWSSGEGAMDLTASERLELSAMGRRVMVLFEDVIAVCNGRGDSKWAKTFSPSIQLQNLFLRALVRFSYTANCIPTMQVALGHLRRVPLPGLSGRESQMTKEYKTDRNNFLGHLQLAMGVAAVGGRCHTNDPGTVVLADGWLGDALSWACTDTMVELIGYLSGRSDWRQGVQLGLKLHELHKIGVITTEGMKNPLDNECVKVLHSHGLLGDSMIGADAIVSATPSVDADRVLGNSRNAVLTTIFNIEMEGTTRDFIATISDSRTCSLVQYRQNLRTELMAPYRRESTEIPAYLCYGKANIDTILQKDTRWVDPETIAAAPMNPRPAMIGAFAGLSLKYNAMFEALDEEKRRWLAENFGNIVEKDYEVKKGLTLGAATLLEATAHQLLRTNTERTMRRKRTLPRVKMLCRTAPR